MYDVSAISNFAHARQNIAHKILTEFKI